ncbi:ATP-binding protein [Aggregatilineales bacterium SYSU G02658]
MWWTKLLNLLDVLTQPSDQLTDSDQRQRARILASIAGALLVSSCVLLLLLVVLMQAFSEVRFVAAGTLVILTGAYLLSRTRYYLVGAALLVASVFFMVMGILLIAPGDTVAQMQTLYFLSLGVAFASFFFNRRALIVVVLLSIGVIGWFFTTRSVPASLVYALLVFFGVTVSLIVISTLLNFHYRQQLLQSEELYRSAVSSLSEGVVVHAPNGSIIASNEAAAAILGLTMDQLLGKDSFDPQWQSIHEDGSPFPPEEHPVMVTLRTGQELSGVVMGVHQPNRALRWISISSRKLKTTPGVVVSFADITEARLAEQNQQRFVDDMRALQLLHLELSESRDLDELLKQMVSQAQQRLGLERVGLMLLSEDGTTLYGTFGCDPTGALRDERYYTERVTEDHWTLHIAQMPDHVRLLEEVTLHDDRLPVGEGWAAQSALWNGTRAIGYLVTDNLITKRPPRLYESELLSILGSTFGHLIERKRSEMALIESEGRLRALLSALPDLVLRLNADGVYLDLHAPNDSDLVAPRDQIIGRRIDQLLPADVSAKVMEALRRVMLTNQEQVIEYDLEIGGALKSYEARMVASQPGEALTIVRNVTANKEAQKREFDLALEQERVRLLRQFIEKASHEFRTPLAIINSSAYLMARSEDASSREWRAVLIQQQINRLVKILDALFLLARLESGTIITLAPLNVSLTVRDVCQAANMEHRESPPLTLTIEEGLPLVMAHAGYLKEAIVQILDNAYRFTPPDGAIYIDVYCIEQGLCIQVRDNGSGIHPDHQPYIFDVFWQHNPTDSTPGLGIGLSIVRRVVEAHNGQIDVQSAPNEGTTVSIVMPTLEAAS